MKRGIRVTIITVAILLSTVIGLNAGPKGLIEISTEKTKYTEGEIIELRIEAREEIYQQRKGMHI